MLFNYGFNDKHIISYDSPFHRENFRSYWMIILIQYMISQEYIRIYKNFNKIYFGYISVLL